MIDPEPNKLTFRFCESKNDIRIWIDLRTSVSRLPYLKAPGRDIKILVLYEGLIIGILGFSSPVMALGPRDTFLKLPTGKYHGRGLALREVIDMSTCVSIQPWGWQHNGGKLLALLATSNEVAKYYQEKYGDMLKWIASTSIYGESIQYDRIYKFLGFSKGFGHIHIRQGTYEKMLEWMRLNNLKIPGNRFGQGANARMRRIAAFFKYVGKKPDLKHNQKRGVYIHAANEKPIKEIFSWWYERWARRRLERLQTSNERFKKV
jgi:hypothetical protein